jgi:DNA-binding NarL/FixJ family response regulator
LARLLARRGEEDDSTYQVRDEDTTLHIEGLTPVQTEVVDQLLKGRKEAEIAAMLDKSPDTVHTHLKASTSASACIPGRNRS